MDKYFSKITADYWTLRNQAHQQARELAQSLDRHLLNKKDVEEFIDDFKQGIIEINTNNPRCKNLSLTVWSPWSNEYGDTMISVSGNFTMYLYKVVEK